MKISQEEKNFRFLALYRRIDKLSNINYFKDNPILDDEKQPEKATFQVRKYYLFVSSPLKEKRAVLRRYCSLRLKINSTTYFLFQDFTKLQRLSYCYECQITNKITISYKDDIRYTFNNKRKWTSNPDTILEAMEEVEKLNFTLYSFNPSDNYTQLPVLIDTDGKKTADNFINTFYKKENTIKSFYLDCLCFHLLHKSGIIKQYQVNKVKISNFDLRKLLPPSNFYLKDLQEITKPKYLKSIIAEENFHVFEFDLDKLENIRTAQFIQLPFKFLYKAFAPKAFNSNLKYFLLLMFGFHLHRNPQVKYKLSTIIKTAEISQLKANRHILRMLNKPLKYLSDSGIIANYQEITKEDLIMDKAINLKLYEPSRIKF